MPLPLSQDALDGLMLEGENIVSAARKAIARHDFSAVLTVFPVLRHLKQTKPEVDQVLQVCVWGGRGAVGRMDPAALPGMASHGNHVLCPSPLLGGWLAATRWSCE